MVRERSYLRAFFLCSFAILMGRILALDYGEKRTGIAITDEFQIIASICHIREGVTVTIYIAASIHVPNS